MKKNIKKATLISVFLVAFSLVSLASYTCLSVVIDCGDGRGTIGLACGNSTQEIADEAWQLYLAFCNVE
jgi:hypothetical protein